jgi:hypothetical protein
MPKLPSNVKVTVFDPATPFDRILVNDPGMDTWHDITLITKKLRDKLVNVNDEGVQEVELSGGMYIKIPYVYIGAQVGSVRFEKFEVVVVDDGSYDILLGRNIFDALFKMQNEQDTNTVSFTSDTKEDSTALSFELYPVEYPFNLLNLEKVVKNLRVLHNIALIANKSIKVSRIEKQIIENVLLNDGGIPDELRLKVSILDSGSVWISLKSGSIAGLKYVASFFERGAVAKLSQEVADSQKNEVEANISKETREITIEKILSENEKFKAENIHATYETFRKECRARIQFIDEIIEQVDNPQLKEQISKQKQEALLEMANLQMVPIVRNIPGSYFSIKEPDTGLPALPAPKIGD